MLIVYSGREVKFMQFGAGYIRVSTDNQDEYSPEAQKRLILEYAKKHDIVINKQHIFEDIGISGTNAAKRASFQDMIALAKSKEHPFDVILVWKFSRFARNQEESILYKSLLKRSGVSVISVSEPIIDGPFGSLIERILEWMDEYYSIRLSGEVRRGMMQKALNGGYNGSIPYGYVMGKDNTPVPVPEQIHVVKNIFDLYVNQNRSISSISMILNNAGYQTTRGNRFERRIVRYILENPFYTGKIRWNYAPPSRGKEKAGDVIIRDGRHEPVISEELFQKAQDILKHSYESFHSTERRVPSISAKHWLSGLLKCSNCGSSLSFAGGKKYKYFRCWKNMKGICETNSCIPLKKAESYVINGLKELLLSDSLNYEKIPIRPLDTNQEFLYANLKDIEKKEERIKIAYIDGIDSLEEYKNNKRALEKQRKKIEKQLTPKKSPSIQDIQAILLSNIENTIRIIEGEYDNERKSEAIRSVCSRITYDRKKDSVIFDLFIAE